MTGPWRGRRVRVCRQAADRGGKTWPSCVMVVTGEVAGLKDSADPQGELAGLRAVRAGGSDPQFGAGWSVGLSCCWRLRCRPCHERRGPGLAAFVEIKQAVLRLSAPRHRRSTTPSAGPADGRRGK